MSTDKALPRDNCMTDAQIKHLVDRFLGWKLPANFNPDAGISFKADFNVGTPYQMKHEPSGTNLFDADQATAMVRYMIEGLPDAPQPPPAEMCADGAAHIFRQVVTGQTTSGVIGLPIRDVICTKCLTPRRDVESARLTPAGTL